MDREPDWGRIKSDYATGDLGYRELAKKYNVSASTLTRRGGRENWPKAREEARSRIASRVQQKMEGAIVEQKSAQVGRIMAISNTLLEKIEQAAQELDRAMVKRKNRTRVVEYKDPGARGKPTREIIDDAETIDTCDAPLDRFGIQQLSIALKNVRDVLAGSAGGEDDDAVKKVDEVMDRINEGMQDG